ncbi:MAG: anaerobic ribonucleoside-triphosphate reductase activating protein [Oscillospiraceae bacterium]|nr:anaerobic ribonucleoside-triphosphate reductase activating protein [Oscillospiraceae bacterium]
MNIGGIQKLTLIDFPDKTACTIFTAGCNYRCLYCHNKDLLEFDESSQNVDNHKQVIDFLKSRVGLLEGVCISGGEPLLQEDIIEFVKEIKQLGFLVKIDTNGSNPKKLKELINNKYIDYVAMDIKNSPENYAKTIDKEKYDIKPIEESLAILRNSKIPYELRTTVTKELHTLDDLIALAKWVSPADKYFLQNYVDSDNVLQKGFIPFSNDEMNYFLTEIRKYLPNAEIR